MGKLLIELPNNINRHYQVDDEDFARELIKALDSSAHRVKNNPSLSEVEQDAQDVRRANRILKNGEFVSWEEAEAYLDR